MMRKALGAFVIGIASGLFAPDAVEGVLSPPHCTAGCKFTFVGDQGASCASIQVQFALLSGYQGTCQCQGYSGCQVDTGCLLSMQVTFAPSVPGVGCVYDRNVGGTSWGQTGFVSNVTGCGSMGESREVCWSSSCDPATDIDCQLTLLTYCANCDGRCP